MKDFIFNLTITLLLLACVGVFLELFGCNKSEGVIGQLPERKLSVQLPGSANIPIVIVAGQSNAVGQGDTTVGHVQGVEWRGGDYQRGIGEYFATEYLQHTNRPEVIVIQCAVGGTSINQWMPGGALDAQCQGYLAKVIAEFPSARVATVLWWQGEADTSLPGIPWTQDFAAIVRAWRFAFGNVPVEFCQLAANHSATGYPYWGYIQAQQASVSIPGVTMVQTQDIGNLASDNLHMTSVGLEIVGERLARAYFGVIGD